jgi:hypothetical protein
MTMRSVGRFFAAAIGPLSGITGLLGWFGVGPSSLRSWVDGHLLLTFLVVMVANAGAVWIYRAQHAGAQAPVVALSEQSLGVEAGPEAALSRAEHKGCLTLQANTGCFTAQLTFLGIAILIVSFVVLARSFPDLGMAPDDVDEPTFRASALMTPTLQAKPPPPTPALEHPGDGSGGASGSGGAVATMRPAGSLVAASPVASPAIGALPDGTPSTSPSATLEPVLPDR